MTCTGKQTSKIVCCVAYEELALKGGAEAQKDDSHDRLTAVDQFGSSKYKRHSLLCKHVFSLKLWTCIKRVSSCAAE